MCFLFSFLRKIWILSIVINERCNFLKTFIFKIKESSNIQELKKSVFFGASFSILNLNKNKAEVVVLRHPELLDVGPLASYFDGPFTFNKQFPLFSGVA